MSAIEGISVNEDVTLIFLNDFSGDMKVITDIYKKTAEAGIKSDMIFINPANSRQVNIGFTVNDEMFGDVIKILSELRRENHNLKFTVSSSNVKFDISGDVMNILDCLSDISVDVSILLIEKNEISLLVTKADMGAVLMAMEKII